MALTATNLTITVNERNIEGKKKRNRCTITLTSADTYPSAGIPLPTYGSWGMVRQLDYIIVLDNVSTLNSELYVWSYSASDGSQGTLRGYGTATVGTAAVALTELATTVTVGASASFLVEAVGW